VINSDNKVSTTTLNVAEVFGKDHHNVIKKLESLDCTKEFNEVNFNVVEYKDKKGELRKAYEMTKDGWTMLVFAFTGILCTFKKLGQGRTLFWGSCIGFGHCGLIFSFFTKEIRGII
jgi:Rha family phage regulatory protein